MDGINKKIDDTKERFSELENVKKTIQNTL